MKASTPHVSPEPYQVRTQALSCTHRHHRYIFEEKEKRDPGQKVKRKRVVARLQELGPRFALKLLSLQKGTWDSRHGEYEWIHKVRAP